MQNYAILVDAGFAKRKLGNGRAPADINHFNNLFERIKASEYLSNQRLHRIYYYDSTPLEETYDKPLSDGAKIDFSQSPVVAAAKSLFDHLSKYPFVALRLGELSFNGWQLKNKVLKKATADSATITHADLAPNITQKGVDMRIGMDIAALTLKKQVQTIVLVTGDSDFIPAMKFARREGANLYLVTLGHNVKASMLEHSDIVLDIAASEL